MRFFSGLSFGRRGARAGISSSGRLWAGARAGRGGIYAGVLGSSGKAAGSSEKMKSRLTFTIDEDGTVRLGEGVVDVEALRAIVKESDNRKGKS